jgi:uncharacterized protein (DUF1697 family)
MALGRTAVRNVAFIRNIMVGRVGLTQPVLLEAFERSGGQDIVSVLATGNIVFNSDDAMNVAGTASAWLRSRYGSDDPVFVRTLDHLRAFAAGNPFSVAPTADIYEQCISFAAQPLSLVGPLPIESIRRDLCVFRIVANEAFSVTRLIGSRCGAPGPTLEKLSWQQVTTRNWKTVVHLLDK